ncbi:MAG: hypothetical protein HFI08_06200 [Bacilli bacterium]|nr:hypothetical protein [Bacilli bacterium]
MDYQLQLLSFLISFLFGLFFSFTSRVHYNFVFSLKKLWRYILTGLFILDIALFYVLLMYYFNHGIVHIYFVGVTFIGYFIEKRLTLYVKKYVKSIPLIAKYLNK